MLIMLFVLLSNTYMGHAQSNCLILPNKLSVEYMINPMGVQSIAPRLSWKLSNMAPPGKNELRQGTYQIECGSKPGNNDIWNSGLIYSNQTLSIVYDGRQLRSRERVWWHVTVTEHSDPKVNCTSQDGAYWFEMGLLDDSDWGTAQWLSRGSPPPQDDCGFYSGAAPRAPLFRTRFTSASKSIVSRARLYISCLGYCDLYFNGQRIGHRVLDPAWTSTNKRIFYSTYNVTTYFKHDVYKYALGVWLGNGWFNPLPLRFWGRINIRDALAVGWEPHFRLNLFIEYSDGKIQQVVSNIDSRDSNWRVGDSPIIFHNIYLGEVYDARLFDPNWSRFDFNDSTWLEAKLGTSPPPLTAKLIAQSIPPVRSFLLSSTEKVPVTSSSCNEKGNLHQDFYIIKLTSLSSDNTTMVADMGRNFAGTIELEVEGTSGSTIDMRFGEILWPNGTVNGLTSVAGQIKKKGTGGPCAPDIAYQQDKYILAGGSYIWKNGSSKFLPGREVWRGPRFGWHGFRYVLINIINGTINISSIRAYSLHTDVPSSASFVSSSSLLNNIHTMIRNTYMSNMMGVQSDCPHRERFGYGGDLLGTARTGIWNWDMSSFYEKRILDFHDSVDSSTGGITEIAPDVGISDAGVTKKSGPIGWGSVQPLLAWFMYLEYGNYHILQAAFPISRRYADLLQRHTMDTVQHGLSDWMSLEPSPVELTGLVFLYRVLSCLSGMSSILGNPKLSNEYSHNASVIAKLINQNFLDPTTGIYASKSIVGSQNYDKLVKNDTRFFNDANSGWSGTQCAQALALYDDLVPPNIASKTLAVLVKNIHQHDQHLTTGLFCTEPLLVSLSDLGYNNLSLAIMSQKTYPSFGYMLSYNATTIWESWSWSTNTFSHNHPMFGGGAGLWLKESIGGIRNSQILPPGLHNKVDTNVNHQMTLGEHDWRIGYGKILIAPRVDTNSIALLSWANTSYDSIRGIIKTAWSLTALPSESTAKSPFKYNLEVSIPPNTYASISFPINTIQWRYIRQIPESSIWRNGWENNQFEANGGGTYLFEAILKNN